MAHQPTAQLFYNPRSGGFCGRKLRALADAIRAEGARVILTPSADGEPVLSEEATHVCIAGGDGTIRHVAAMLAQRNAALPVAIYPAGTINLLAREGDSTRDPARFARILFHGGSVRPHHPVTLGRSMFFACASVGPDSKAVAGVSPALKKMIGRAAYLVAFVHQLWTWRRPRIRLRADGRTITCEAVYIAKGRFFAGPWSFAPAASVSDTRLHIVALSRARRRDYLRFVWSMLSRQDPAMLDGVSGFTCSELTIESDVPLPVQADGDIVAACPAHLAVHPTPLNIR